MKAANFIFVICLSLAGFSSFADSGDLVVDCTTPRGASRKLPSEGVHVIEGNLLAFNFRGLALSPNNLYYQFNQPVFNRFESGCVLKTRDPRKTLIVRCESDKVSYGQSVVTTQAVGPLALGFFQNVMNSSHLFTLNLLNYNGVPAAPLSSIMRGFEPTVSQACTFGAANY